ncbi:MAG: hypothetical protein LBU70_07555, partial [Chitinispirillales bacterium]|nr:hypothetical protein [Chitinispirillales bacterium]
MKKDNAVLTYEQLISLFQETDRRLADLSTEFKRAAEERDRAAAERDKKAAERDKKAAERDKKAAERLKKLEEVVGGIGNNNGYYAEEFFQNSFSANLEFAGIKFDHMIKNVGFSGKENGEFDILLVNGDTVAIIEAKYRIHSDFVEQFVNKKLKQFRRFFPMYQNHAVYLGIAGMSF